MSFNLLRRIPADVLRRFTKLKTAYFIQNKIGRIEGLEPLAGTLTSIELGGNKLRVRSQYCWRSSLTCRPEDRESRRADQLD